MYGPLSFSVKPLVMGKVILSVVVVISTKIARSRIQAIGELRELIIVKVSEITRKRQGCPKGTTKAINRACFLLDTPISHTHSNQLHMHAPYPE